jgi:hypothetical protein
MGLDGACVLGLPFGLIAAFLAGVILTLAAVFGPWGRDEG